MRGYTDKSQRPVLLPPLTKGANGRGADVGDLLLLLLLLQEQKRIPLPPFAKGDQQMR
ncbi:hypothetical protein D3C71_2078390 [compost metagenome]